MRRGAFPGCVPPKLPTHCPLTSPRRPEPGGPCRGARAERERLWPACSREFPLQCEAAGDGLISADPQSLPVTEQHTPHTGRSLRVGPPCFPPAATTPGRATSLPQSHRFPVTQMPGSVGHFHSPVSHPGLEDRACEDLAKHLAQGGFSISI